MFKFLESIAGFGVTFSTMFKRPITEGYPEKKKPTAARFHGSHQLNRYADGLEKCIGCELCAWACPADAIYVEGADNTEAERFSPGERYGQQIHDKFVQPPPPREALPTHAPPDQPNRLPYPAHEGIRRNRIRRVIGKLQIHWNTALFRCGLPPLLLYDSAYLTITPDMS